MKVNLDLCAHAQLVDSAEAKSKVVPKKKNTLGSGSVSSPDPPRSRPIEKLEREKKEGLVNRHTTSCSFAGMLAELSKTLIVTNGGHQQRVLKFLSTNWAMKACGLSKKQ